MIRQDYIHTVPVAQESRSYLSDGTRVDHYVLKGTSEQISQHIAQSLKSNLDNGTTTRFELTPVAPFNIVDLTERGA